MKRNLPIFYSALLLTGVNLLLRLVGTSFQVYISGRIGAAGVGLLQLVLSVSMMAMTAGIAGIRTTSMYLTAGELGRKRPGNVGWMLSGCFRYSIFCSAAVAFLLYWFAPQIAQSWIGDIRTLPALRLVAAFLPVNCLCGVMVGYFTAANRIGTLAVVEIFEQLFSMAITMAGLAFWAKQDPGKACLAVVLGSGMGTCLTLLCLTVLRIKERVPLAPKISVGKQILSAAIPLALADDLKSGISTAENLMVPKRLGLYPGTEDPLAAFGMVCGMVFPVLMFPAAILFALAELLIPELARCAAAQSHQRIGYLVRRSLRVTLLYGCIFSTLMYLGSETLCQWLYQSSEAAVHLRRFAFLIPMLYCDAITDAMIKGLGQQTASVRYNIVTSFLDIVFLYLLLPRYGMDGYFLSFLVTHLINFLLSIRRLLKISRQRLRLRLPLLSILCTVFSVWAASFLPTVILQIAGCLLILGCLLFLLRVLGKEDLLWIQGLFYKKAPSVKAEGVEIKDA